LAELGFGMTNLSGRVTRGNGVWGPEFDHLALLPEDELYLVDVGPEQV
jgi:arylamine N-acetyltransferase